MEDTLRDNEKETGKSFGVVLILVLMEDTLRENEYYIYERYDSLNPCFNGRYSQRVDIFTIPGSPNVLILVLMEDTLRELSVEAATGEENES